MALRDAEERARRAKRGLWQDREPVPPWEWRKLDKDERQRRREASALGVRVRVDYIYNSFAALPLGTGASCFQPPPNHA